MVNISKIVLGCGRRLVGFSIYITHALLWNNNYFAVGSHVSSRGQLQFTVPLIVPKSTMRLLNTYLTKSLNDTGYLRRTSRRKPSRYKVEIEPPFRGVQLLLAFNHLTSSTKMTKLYAVKGRRNFLTLEEEAKPRKTNNKHQKYGLLIGNGCSARHPKAELNPPNRRFNLPWHCNACLHHMPCTPYGVVLPRLLGLMGCLLASACFLDISSSPSLPAI